MLVGLQCEPEDLSSNSLMQPAAPLWTPVSLLFALMVPGDLSTPLTTLFVHFHCLLAEVSRPSGQLWFCLFLM